MNIKEQVAKWLDANRDDYLRDPYNAGNYSEGTACDIDELYISKFKEIVGEMTELAWDEATSGKEMTQEEIFHCEQLATIGINPKDKDAEKEYNANYEFAVEAMQKYLIAQAQLHHSQQEILEKINEL